MYLGGRIFRLFVGVAVLFGIFGLGAFAMNRPVSAVAGINERLNFQGRLYNAQGAIVPDGNYNIQFKIYQDGAGTTAGNPGGTLEWTESWLNSGGNGVQIKNGYLSVELGSINAFGSSVDWNQDTLWLSMNIGDTTSCTITTDFDTDCGGDGEMVPMKRMSSAVYALNAGQLGGLDSTQFVQLAQGVQTDASTNTTSIYLNKTGGGNFLELQSSSTDVFTLSNSGDIEFGANNDHTISVATAGAATGGYDLTVSAGTGGSGTGSAGGDLVLQGGAAGGTDGNGGNVVINAGAKTGTGTDGTVSIGTSNTSGITLGADTNVTADLTLSGSSNLAFNKGSDYSTISGNDVNFGAGSVFRLTGASSQTITGIANGVDGRMITLINASSFNATLADLDGASASANQISTGTGADLVLSVGGAITLIYDSGASKWRVVGGAADSAGAGGVTLQGSTPGTADVGNINVTGTIIGSALQAGSLDTASAGALAIGGTNATSVTIGSASITTTIQGNTAVTLSTTEGTVLVCQNGSGYLSICDSSYQAPTSTNFIQNQNSSQQTGNYWISGVARADTGVLSPSVDVASAGTLSIGTTTATAITLGQSGVDTTIAGGLVVTETATFNDDVTIATGKTLTVTGDTRANITGYTPTAGMVTYDTTNNQLLVYNGTKWMGDRSSTTKIVAASNSSQALKDAADYVADGTADESEINSALTAAAGGTVYLAEGTYVAAGTILVPNNTILVGAGNGTTIELGDLDATDNLIENKDSTSGNATPGSGVVIRDLKLDGRSDLNTTGTQYGVYFSDMGSGTGASAVQGATIENLRITRFRNDGAYLTASSNNTITANNFRNNGAVGLSINASSNNNVISNNRFQGNGAEGFVLSSSSYNNISGNNSEANTTLGMNFTSGGSRNTISGNNINSNGASGMRLSGETRSTIVGNVIRGGGASNYGIYMLNSSNNNAVSSNNIYDTGSAGYTNGIFLDIASYNNLTNNVIGDSSCNFECNAININNAGATNNFIASNNIDSGASIRDTGTGTLYGGQNSGTAYLIQPSQDITIGGASNTTTIQGNTAVTLSSTTGTTQVCQNGSGYLSTCDTSYLAPTATNFIQNQNSTDQTANFRISGVAQANTSVLTPLVGRATAGTLSIGTDANSTAITIGQSGVTTTNAGNLTVSGTTALNDNVTVASGKTLRVTGDTRANITGYTPAAGMITYDTDNNQLLTYNGTKWKADGKDAILVAANDSSQADKDAADYVADGTADDAEIQAALDAADPAGSGRKTGKVYLFAGTYNVSTSITIENNTTIAGAGRGTLLSLISTTSAVKVLTNDDTTTGEGVTIQNLRIDGNNGTVGAQYGIYLDGMGGGTGASARQGAKVNNVVLTRFNTANMYLSSSYHGTFSGITSQASDGDGIGMTGSGYNVFTGNSAQGNTGDGFDIANSNTITITGNTIQNNSAAGIATSSSPSVLTITGNTIRSNGVNGITFAQTTYSTVSGNNIYANTGDGINTNINTTSITYSGNNLYNNSGDGIEIAASFNTVTGNTFISNTNAVLVSGGGNEISGNTMRSNSTAGVSLNGASADNNTVSGNIISSNSSYGVYLAGADKNNVVGNRIYDNGGLTTNNGIYLTNSDNNGIQSNTLTDGNASSNNYSINIFDSTSDTNYLSDNTLGTGSVNDSGTGTIYGGQVDASGNYVVQPTGDIELQGNTNVTGTLTATTALQAPLLDTSAVEALYIGTTNASSINLMKDTNLVGDLTLDATADRTISIGTSAASTAGSQLTIAAGTGGSGSGSIGGDLVLQGGAAGGTNANGGSVYLDAGAKTGSGTNGTIAIGTVAASTIQIGSTTLSSGTQTINIGNNNTSGGTTNVVIGSGGSATAGTTTIQAKDGISILTNGVTRQTFNNTNTVYFGNGVSASSPNNFTISGTQSSASGTAGGALSIQGGNATVGNANGGNLTLSGGTGVGSGSNGLVVLNTPAFATTANDANCFAGGALVASSCSIAQSSIDNSAAVIVGFNTIAQTATMPDPTISTAGKIIYVTAANGSEDFTLSVNGGGTGNTIAMRQNTTATMIWNGSDWTAAGASSSTTLQSAYDNTLQSAGGAELVVSSTGNTNGLTIRDSSVNPVNGTLLSVQSNSAANLFSVNSNVTEYASNAGAESYSGTTNAFPASTWSALTGATVSRNTTTSNIATGQGSAQAATTTSANSGIKNQLNTALTASQHYNVSFTAKLASGTFTDMGVYYSIDGSADSVTCSTGEAIKTSVWTKVNCTFTAPSSGITSSNSINIRQVGGGTARTFYIDNLSVTIAADYNYATDGTVNDTGNFATNWTSTGTGSTVTHNTSDGQEASDSAQAVITTGGSNRGVRNQIAINPLTSTLYRVSVYAKQTAGAAFTDFGIRYSRDGGTNFTDCVDYNTQTVDNTWTQVTCYITTSGTAPTNPYMYFVAGSSANRTFLVDTFSMTLASKSTPNVQIGGGAAGGPTTLFTLDKGASAPIAANNDDLLGSMYYDTTLGKLQCYEADGWGACGSSPDNIVTISPEYTNAVLHGTGIGTMTSDLCSDTLNINDGSSGQATICGTNETYNFYKWTSPQSSAQTYSIYVTYQLPSTFKSFQSGETSIMGRTDDANATVNYQIYRNNSASGLTTCGSAVTVSTGSVSSWQTGVATGAADPSTCGFVGGDSVVFKINVTASQNANAYVGNLNFTFSNR